MKGLILTNAYYDTPATRYQSERIHKELKLRGVDAEIRKNDGFAAGISGGNLVRITGYDFCVYLDKDKYAARALESSGVRLFNCREAIEICDDKALTFIALAGKGVPMPTTLPGLLCYEPKAEISPLTAAYIGGKLGFPLVVKESYGSLGKGVHLAKNLDELTALMERLKCVPHLYQKFIAESAGTDLRVTVVGGRAIAAMKRISAGDFRSNIGLGGRGEKYEIDNDLRALCERVARLIKLDYCGIDILPSKEGYQLCEVNSNAFFGGTEEATGVNVAGAYANHIVEEMKRGGGH